MATPQETIEEAAQRAKEASIVMGEFAQGDSTTQVDNGLPGGIPSLAKFLAEKDAEINEGGDSILAQVVAARDAAIAAQVAAEADAVATAADRNATAADVISANNAVTAAQGQVVLAENQVTLATAQVALATTQANNAAASAASVAGAVNVAYAAQRIKPNSAAGQADVALVSGDYFYVVTTDPYTFELWIKGASTPTDTTLRVPSAVAMARGDRGVVTITGDANVTLSAAQAGYAIILRTGTLTANRVDTVPSTGFKGTYHNATTGAFTLTVQGPTGTGLTVTQGKSRLLEWNGTNVVSPISQAEADIATNASGLALKADKATLDAMLPANAPPGFAWSILDDDGDAAIGVKDDGTFSAKASEIETLTATTLNATNLNGSDVSAIATAVSSILPQAPAGYAWSVTDDDGDAAVGVKNDGTLAASAIELQQINSFPIESLTSSVDAAANQFDAEINHVEMYGQSLGDGALATPAISTSQAYDSIMFNGGVRAYVTGTRTAFAPMVEASQETSMSGMFNMIKQLLLAENGIAYTDQTYQLLGSVAAQAGASIAALSKPGTYYDRITADLTAGYTISEAAGKSYKAACLAWMHGESEIDSTKDAYKQGALNLFGNIAADAASIPRRSGQLHVISYQIASHPVWAQQPNIALALLELAIENSWIHIASPMYLFPPGSDEIHLTNTSEYWYGGYEGIAYKRIFIDKKPYSCLRPTAAVKQGRVILVPFTGRVGNLVLGDTSLVALNTNNGIELVDAADSPLTISSMSIVNGKFLKIVASAEPPAGAVLWFGRKTDKTGTFDGIHWIGVNGPVNGPRINLRDSQGDTITFNVNGTTRAMHNYCAIARVPIT